eukprot:6174505-Pleurochrysis_carterae.AAC.6
MAPAALALPTKSSLHSLARGICAGVTCCGTKCGVWSESHGRRPLRMRSDCVRASRSDSTARAFSRCSRAASSRPATPGRCAATTSKCSCACRQGVSLLAHTHTHTHTPCRQVLLTLTLAHIHSRARSLSLSLSPALSRSLTLTLALAVSFSRDSLPTCCPCWLSTRHRRPRTQMSFRDIAYQAVYPFSHPQFEKGSSLRVYVPFASGGRAGRSRGQARAHAPNCSFSLSCSR